MAISPGPAQKEATDQAIQSCDPLNNAHIFLPLPLIGATPLEGDLDPSTTLSGPSVRQHVDDENGHEITFLILKSEAPNSKSIRDSGLTNAALKSCRSIFGFVSDWGMEYSGFSNGAWNNMITSPL